MGWYQKRSKTAKNMARSIKQELGFGLKPAQPSATKAKGKAKSKAKARAAKK